jgi:hypothetical protein
MTEFEQRQLKAIREELDRAHATRVTPATNAAVTASPTRYLTFPSCRAHLARTERLAFSGQTANKRGLTLGIIEARRNLSLAQTR